MYNTLYIRRRWRRRLEYDARTRTQMLVRTRFVRTVIILHFVCCFVLCFYYGIAHNKSATTRRHIIVCVIYDTYVSSVCIIILNKYYLSNLSISCHYLFNTFCSPFHCGAQMHIARHTQTHIAFRFYVSLFLSPRRVFYHSSVYCCHKHTVNKFPTKLLTCVDFSAFIRRPFSSLFLWFVESKTRRRIWFEKFEQKYAVEHFTKEKKKRFHSKDRLSVAHHIYRPGRLLFFRIFCVAEENEIKTLSMEL